MTSRRQFALIFLSTVAIASLASHATFRLLGIQPILPYPDSGVSFHTTPIIVAGSSLINYGLDWDAVATEFSRRVKVLTVPAASPCELEVLQAEAPKTDFTIIGISESDMDENVVSDFRADIVPAIRTWCDLQSTHAEGGLLQRTMSKYPLHYARALFPMAGRSIGVLLGIRQVWRRFRGQAATSSDPAPTFNVKAAWPTNRISDWEPGRALRNLATARQISGGHHSFSGPKHLALERMLRSTLARGKTVVVVMPVSPLYSREVIDPSVIQAFERSVEKVTSEFPQATWIRVDQIAALHSDSMYWDLFHLNADGRAIATAKLLEQLKPLPRAQ